MAVWVVGGVLCVVRVLGCVEEGMRLKSMCGCVTRVARVGGGICFVLEGGAIALQVFAL
ncbi:hypothetical protein [Bartonella schoenbuchensis]|uniref:hypothetical protein n=1 Tax=Bartonella schoenbuchensis TaxID=165694 RepID=UPI00039DF97A|nr:hypothetical protein [Bartonella schoenbuchensis]